MIYNYNSINLLKNLYLYRGTIANFLRFLKKILKIPLKIIKL